MLKVEQWIGIRSPHTSMKSSSRLLQLKRAVQKQQRPSAAKNNFFLKMTHSLRILLFSHSVMSGSLRRYGLQHARLPCPSLSPELAQTHVHRLDDAIQPSHPLSNPSLSALSLSQHQGLSQWVGFLHQVAKILELLLQHHSFQWTYSGLISFRIEWFQLLAVQRTLKTLLQHHSSNALILWYSAFFMVQLTSVYDCWKNHSFDYTDLCWQSDISAF